MEVVFLNLLNRSITAGWLILTVLVLRVILKKAPKTIRCVLWALVGVRLICPFSFESVLSLIPSAETIPQEILYVQEPAIESGVSTLNQVINPIISKSFAPNEGDSVNPLQTVVYISSVIWLVGLLAMIIYAGVSFLRIHGKVAASMQLTDNIFICDYIDTPFIFGILRPGIYLPSVLVGEKAVYVIAHEKAHLKRHDHWWKPIGFVLLSVYWFNPVIWVAYILLCRDIELACDERVVRELGESDKKAYSDALLFCSVSRKMIAACPLAFGEVGVKERVRSVLNYKKPTFWMLAVAAGACIIVAVCFLTNPKKEEQGENISVMSEEMVGETDDTDAAAEDINAVEDSDTVQTESIDEEIAELLDTIAAPPEPYMSAPGDYIALYRDEYDKLTEYGEFTLHYCFTQFLMGEQTDLRGHIMKSACEDIMESLGEPRLEDSVFATGQDWFDAFRANAESLERRYDREELEKNYPASWQLIQTLQKIR